MIEKRRQGFDAWLSRYKIKSTILLATGVWMMIDAYQWSTAFAASSFRTGAEIALIIAAIQGVATLYVGWVFKIYMENRNL
jgi:hypothetical protein